MISAISVKDRLQNPADEVFNDWILKKTIVQLYS